MNFKKIVGKGRTKTVVMILILVMSGILGLTALRSQGAAQLSIDGAAQASHGSVATISLTTTNSPDLIYVIGSAASSGTLAITDKSNLAWTERSFSTYGSTTLEAWYAISNSPLASDQITVTFSVAANLDVLGWGISGANLQSPFDTTPINSHGSSYLGSVSVTTHNSNDLVLGMIGQKGTGTAGSETGWNFIATPGSYPLAAAEYQLTTSTGTFKATFSLPKNYYWTMIGDAILSAATSTISTTTTTTTNNIPPPAPGVVQHFIVIMGENEPYTSVYGSSQAPYENKLANDYTLFSNYYGHGQPSLFSYMQLTGGTGGNITETCDIEGNNTGCVQSTSDISLLVNQAGLNWKEYAESMPASCQLQNSSDNLYVVKHNPFAYYSDVVQNTSYCDAHIVPMNMTTGQGLINDLKNGNLPTYSFITPNICDDGHNLCGSATSRVAEFDSWLATVVPKIQSSTSWNTTAILITYDESGTASEHIFSILVSPFAKNNYTDNTFYTQNSGLLTAEQLLGVGYLGHNDTVSNSFCTDLYLNNPCSSSMSITFGQTYSNNQSHSILLAVQISGSGDAYITIGQVTIATPAVSLFLVVPSGETYSFGDSGSVSIKAEISR